MTDQELCRFSYAAGPEQLLSAEIIALELLDLENSVDLI